ncbi:MAG: class I SAM-dependent methyltransferase [Acidimicrobiia bacterium]
MDASDWDRRYDTAEFVWHTDPNRFLPPEAAGLSPGRALDLACGEGRNAVWLASQGWQATGVDFSTVGISKGADLAARHGVHVEWIVDDVTTWSPPPDGYDLVVVFYLQLPEVPRRAAMAVAARSLAPGGTLLVVGHDLANLSEGVGGPQDPSVLYTAGDLVDDLERSGVALAVERSEELRRPVETDAGTREAIDCFVRARRVD